MPRLTAEQWAEVRARREAGESFPSLANAFGISHQAIQKRAKDEGWGDGIDVGVAVRRKVAEKVAGVVAGGNPKKTAEILDAVAEKGAGIVRRQQEDWETHRQRFGSVPADFEDGKLAKITAEMLKIRHDGERTAHHLDEPGSGQTDIKIAIVRETKPWDGR